MSLADAWLLDIGENLRIAVGNREMTEFLPASTAFAVPGAPAYCARVIRWQEWLIPVMDIAALAGQSAVKEESQLAILAYQSEPETPLSYVAVPIFRPPVRIRVDDDSATDLPDEVAYSALNSLVLSAFEHNSSSALILDIARLCSAEYRDSVTPLR